MSLFPEDGLLPGWHLYGGGGVLRSAGDKSAFNATS